MKHRLLVVIVRTTAVFIVLCVCLWISSYRLRVCFAWSPGPTYHQVMSYRGVIYHVVNRKWWCEVPFFIEYDTNPGNEPITEFAGVRIEYHATWLGFERATGEWVSSYVEIREDTVFSPTHQPAEPGTMYRSITPVEITGIPYAALTLVFTAICCGTAFLARDRNPRL